MQLGMIGLGRMGGNMAKRLEEHGHEVKTFDPQVESTAKTIEDLRDQLGSPRTFWMMVPAGVKNATAKPCGTECVTGTN